MMTVGSDNKFAWRTDRISDISSQQGGSLSPSDETRYKWLNHPTEESRLKYRQEERLDIEGNVRTADTDAHFLMALYWRLGRLEAEKSSATLSDLDTARALLDDSLRDATKIDQHTWELCQEALRMAVALNRD